MRFVLAAVVIAALPGVAAAQSPGDAVAHPGLPPISAPLPQIGLPLPPISFPLPSISLPPRDVAPLPSSDEQRKHRQRLILFPAFGWVYGYQGMTWSPDTTPPAAREKQPEEPLFGTLLLYVEPEESLQVFIDGYYVGTAEDFNRGLEIEAGPHTVELSAPGYESVTFNVRIDPSRPITYRGTLKPLAAKPPGAAAPAPAAPPSTTLYYIPGCYLGNVDPKDVKLPANCDLSRLVTRKMR